MQDNFGRRLKTQLIMVFVSIITVMMVLVSWFTYKKVEAVVEKQSADITQQYFQQNEHNIKTFMEEVSTFCKLLTQSASVRQYIRSGWKNEFNAVKSANEVFRETAMLMETYSYVDSIFFYGDNGVVLGINGKENIVIRDRSRKQMFYESVMYENALRSPWTTLWYGNYDSFDFEGSESMRAEEADAYITAVANIHFQGRHAGCVVVNVKEPKLADMISYSDESRKRESYIIDENGIILVHDDFEKLGERVEFSMEMTGGADGYFMRDDVQVNFRRLQGGQVAWTLISEVPVSVLHADMYSLRQLFVGAVAAALAVGTGLAVYFLYRLTRPLDELREAMSQMEQGKLGGQLKEDSKNELGMLGRQFNQMSQSIVELVNKVQMAEDEKRMLEKEALQAQINPHFLFNTLSNIKYMAMIMKSNTIADSITALGNFLAPIYKSRDDTWTMKDEIAYVENYVNIMNYRFGGQIRTGYEIPDEISSLYLLKFILQPLVENAIQHGFGNREGAGTITVRAGIEGKQLAVWVEDDGCGLTEEELTDLRIRMDEYGCKPGQRQGNIGLGNVHRRLKIYYGADYGVTVESRKDIGTTVCVRVPIIQGT